MNMRQQKTTTGWERTKFANIVRFVSSGTLFARFKARGKLIRQSLETADLEVAKRRLDALVTQERGAVENQRNGKLTIADAVKEFRERGYRVALNGRTRRKVKPLKPRTRAYYEERIKAMLESWPGLETTAIRSISQKDCEKWADKFANLTSASAYNHTVSVLRQVLQVGVDAGARYDNPGAGLGRMSEAPKKLKLPEPSHFNEFIRHARNANGRFSKDCADLIEFLAYSGCRKSEAANVLKEDVDLGRGAIRIYGDPINRTKNGEARTVPIIADMRQLLNRLLAERQDDPPTSPLMRVRECQKSMNRAAKLAGMERVTHHDMRHLFATRCIESGVDIPTVSRWLGHKDGGALAMRVYGHLRDAHSQDMARLVNFNNNVTALPKAGAL